MRLQALDVPSSAPERTKFHEKAVERETRTSAKEGGFEKKARVLDAVM